MPAAPPIKWGSCSLHISTWGSVLWVKKILLSKDNTTDGSGSHHAVCFKSKPSTSQWLYEDQMIRKQVLNMKQKKTPSKSRAKFPYLFAVFDIVRTHETGCLNQSELFAPAKVFCTSKNVRQTISNCLHLSLGKYREDIFATGKGGMKKVQERLKAWKSEPALTTLFF